MIQLNNLAAGYAHAGEYQRALTMHLRVLEMRRALHDTAGRESRSTISATPTSGLGKKQRPSTATIKH